MEINKGDILYYARILPSVGVYDVLDIKIRTISDDWLVGLETRDKQAFLFSVKDLNIILFEDRLEALMKVKEAEEHRTVFFTEVDYEEY